MSSCCHYISINIVLRIGDRVGGVIDSVSIEGSLET